MSLNHTHIDSSSNKSITQTFIQNPLPNPINKSIAQEEQLGFIWFYRRRGCLELPPLLGFTRAAASSSCCGCSDEAFSDEWE